MKTAGKVLFSVNADKYILYNLFCLYLSKNLTKTFMIIYDFFPVYQRLSRLTNAGGTSTEFHIDAFIYPSRPFSFPISISTIHIIFHITFQSDFIRDHLCFLDYVSIQK